MFTILRKDEKYWSNGPLDIILYKLMICCKFLFISLKDGGRKNFDPIHIMHEPALGTVPGVASQDETKTNVWSASS